MAKCKGQTKAGKKCKKNAVKGTQYCPVHTASKKPTPKSTSKQETKKSKAKSTSSKAKKLPVAKRSAMKFPRAHVSPYKKTIDGTKNLRKMQEMAGRRKRRGR